MIVWITGISGAGKTTIGEKVFNYLDAQGKNVIFLDGDSLRKIFSSTKDTSYERENRIKLALQYSKLCKFLSDSGLNVVISTISMYKEVFKWNKENLDNYFDIYLKVPKEVVQRRDAKGLYADLNSGKVSNVAGFDLKIDEPEDPKLIIKNHGEISPTDAFNSVIDLLKNH